MTIKWSAFSAGSAIATSNNLVGLQSGANVKWTFTQLATFILGASRTFTGNLLSASATGGVGYATGAGNVVTQGTDKTTAVTINAVTGAITTNNATLTANTSVTFQVNNSAVVATDVVIVNIKSGATANSYNVGVAAVGSTLFKIQIDNITAGDLGEALVLNYAVIKGVAS